MQLSAEVRWFGRGPIPDGLNNWFREPGTNFQHRVGGGRDRSDEYLLLRGRELGIKRRGGKKELVEVKGLVEILPRKIRFGRVEVLSQLFCKWDTEDKPFDAVPTVKTVKTRWLRKFDTSGDLREILLGAGESLEDPALKTERPDVGCNVELTKVEIGEEKWWTFGAESFAFGHSGRTIELVSQGLFRVLDHLSSHANVDLQLAKHQGYSEWISDWLETTSRAQSVEDGRLARPRSTG